MEADLRASCDDLRFSRDDSTTTPPPEEGAEEVGRGRTPGRSLLVQKYGGTSVGTASRMEEVAKLVQASLEEGEVYVVLSAMSSQVKYFLTSIQPRIFFISTIL